MNACRPFFRLQRNVCSSSIRFKARRSKKTTTLPISHETFRGEETDLEAGTFHYSVEQSSFTDNDLPRRLRLASNVNVKSLILGSSLYNFAAEDWDELPTELQAALQHVIRLPTLEHLDIRNFKNVPPSLLSAATFSSLFIKHTKFRKSKPHERKSTPPDTVTRLKSFSYNNISPSSIRALVRGRIFTDSFAIDFSSLQSLSVSLHDADEVAASKEVMNVSPNLNYLLCSVGPKNSLGEVSSSLASCRSLKTLVLFFEVGDELQDPLLGLPDALSEMSGDNVLEELLINAHVQSINSCRTDAMWGRLDDVLSRSAFHTLRRVSLKIILWINDICFFDDELEERRVGERHRKVLKGELEKIRASQFSWLSNARNVKFEFAVRIISHGQRDVDPEIQRYLQSDVL
ncbi:uncharacterized protein LACBIDRAFT_310846 [Laccaria bicolor S238N-H82]|uniref:Predicted protein n=1 Tax=Laccaria bicolor (strain S238N-H82 / ATCC MYA-4686) TaxID=486041 RepID=B0DV80_LACBS|nr:uncharacterized protein LACBIDRAFT_310846 [Laccaria bicolor S238N-H82]EDR01532.1 predicted protein [Laccaria bicolor S238N-H82]|eukprot:XP_001887884.1 predicted protein [Laccaria bicolor S238N-H82]